MTAAVASTVFASRSGSNCSFAKTVTTGQSLLIVMHWVYATGSLGSASTTGQADVWTNVLDQPAQGNAHSYAAYLCNSPTLGAITGVAASGGGPSFGGDGIMYVLTGGPFSLDGAATFASSASPIASGSITPSAATDIFFATGRSHDGNDLIGTTASGWTADTDPANAEEMFAHCIPASASAMAPSFTYTGTDASGDVAMFALKLGAGGAAVSHRLAMMGCGV